MKFLTKSDISIGSQLGSQMSQYASLFSLSQKTKHSIVFNKEDLNIGRGIKIIKPFDFKCQIKSKTFLMKKIGMFLVFLTLLFIGMIIEKKY